MKQYQIIYAERRDNVVRNIGEEFWSDWISQPTSTDPSEMRILYRVVEILQVHRHGDFGDMIDAERLEPIKVDRRLPESSQ